MDERVKDYLEKAQEHWNEAAGDNHGQDRDFHTRRSLEILIDAVTVLAGLRWKNGELVPIEPQPAIDVSPDKPSAHPKQDVLVCPLCGERLICFDDGEVLTGKHAFQIECDSNLDECDLIRTYVKANSTAEALALFARITGQAPR